MVVVCRRVGGPGTNDPGLFRCENMSLTNLLSRAYSLTYLLVSGPEWLKSTIFLVSAKVPPGTSETQFEAMLRSLLLDRFKLSAHREQREVAQYDLVLAKSGPKFKGATVKPGTEDEAKPTPPGPVVLGRDGYPALSSGRDMAMWTGGDAFTVANGPWKHWPDSYPVSSAGLSQTPLVSPASTKSVSFGPRQPLPIPLTTHRR